MLLHGVLIYLIFPSTFRAAIAERCEREEISQHITKKVADKLAELFKKTERN